MHPTVLRFTTRPETRVATQTPVDRDVTTIHTGRVRTRPHRLQQLWTVPGGDGTPVAAVRRRVKTDLSVRTHDATSSNMPG